MSIVYCDRGNHLVDLDFNCEGAEINGAWVCWDHLTDEEQCVIESEFNGDPTPDPQEAPDSVLEAGRDEHLSQKEPEIGPED